MTFEAGQLLDIKTCAVCQGKGCQACGQFGIYAELDQQKLIFALPNCFEIGIRQAQQKTTFIKRGALVIAAASLSTLIWLIFLKN